MSSNLEIERRQLGFKSDLRTLSTPEMILKYLTFGDCYALTSEQYLNLRVAVAEHFKIHPSEVTLVGSAKLGFSIAPKKRYLPFRDESDVDVVIVSNRLFEAVWLQLFEYAYISKNLWDEKTHVSFKDYLFRGWIRPDMFPASRIFSYRREWIEFFQRLTSSEKYGRYMINGALYKSWYHFEAYHTINLDICKRETEK